MNEYVTFKTATFYHA